MDRINAEDRQKASSISFDIFNVEHKQALKHFTYHIFITLMCRMFCTGLVSRLVCSLFLHIVFLGKAYDPPLQAYTVYLIHARCKDAQK